MDKRIEWPWSSEEEAEWKSELAKRDSDLVEELMVDAAEDESDSRDVSRPVEEEPSGDAIPDQYSVTA